MCVTRHLAERRKSEEYEESDAEVVRQTAVEAEDAWDAELQTFQPASRTTGQSPDLALPPNMYVTVQHFYLIPVLDLFIPQSSR